MFEYKTTEEFDIGAGHGEYEYDFFTINDEDDFWALINHYGAIYRRFDYFLDGYETTENNTVLSPVVQEKMKDYKSNICLTFLKKGFSENETGIRKMVVNEQMPDNTYNTHFFYFYYFATQDARNYLERGKAFAKSNMQNAAIRCFSHSIKLFPNTPFPYYYRGFSFMERRNYDKAIEDFTTVISFKPEDSSSFSLRGFAYKEAGDIDKAKTDFARALELNPKDKMANECLEEINKM